MAGKPIKVSKGNAELYDAGRRHVLAEKIQPLPDNLKKKISLVLEAIPTRSKAEIAEVLQACEYDVDRALNSFINPDRAMEASNEWMVQGRRKNKNKKKSGKKMAKENIPTQGESKNSPATVENNKQTEKQVEGSEQSTDVLSSSNQMANGKIVPDDIKEEKLTTDEKAIPLVEPITNGELKNDTSKESVPPSPSSAESSKHSPESPGKGKHEHHGHGTHEKKPRIRTHSTSSNEFIKKSLKDLQRSSVSIARFQSILDEDAETSTKLLAKSFKNLREALDERENELAKELENVISETRHLLQERQEDAAGLKFKCYRIGTMSEEEAIELRSEVKHFVGERRIDEDLGKTKRFLRDEEGMIKAIKSFGEVTPVKHHYTTYKKKNPEPVKTKQEEKRPPPLQAVPAASESKSQDKPESSKGPRGRKSRHDPVLSPSRLKDQAEMHARLQEVVKQQAGSLAVSSNKKTPAEEKTKSKELSADGPKLNGEKQTSKSGQHFKPHRGSKNSLENSSKPHKSTAGPPSKINGSEAGENHGSSGPSSSVENGNSTNSDTSKNGVVPTGNSQGNRRTRRHYVRKSQPELNGDVPAFAKNNCVDDKEVDGKTAEEKGAKSETLENGLQKGQNLMASEANGHNPLPQRNHRPRRIYRKKNLAENEPKLSPPKENGPVNSSTNRQPSVA